MGVANVSDTSIAAIAEQFVADKAKAATPDEAPKGELVEEQETPESETGEGSEQEAPEASAEDEEAAAEEKTEEDDEAPKEPEAKVVDDSMKLTLRVGDEDREITLGDLKRGYMQGADYTRKTQELASHRKAFVEHVEQYQQGVKQQIDEVGFLANIFMHQLVDVEKTTDWNQLRQSNPAEYAARQHDIQERREKLQRAYATYQQFQAQQQALEAQKMQQHLADEGELLTSLIPEWVDPRVASSEKKAVAKYLADLGVPAEEIEGLSDSRTVAIARKAMLYDRQATVRKQAEEKATKQAPKFAKPGPRDPAPKKSEHQRLFQRAAKTGSLDDMAAAFSARNR